LGTDTALCILIADDHQDTLDLFARLLRRNGYTVFTARSAAEARALAAEERCDLLISDLGLPDISGLDLMRELRGAYGLKGIAVSGYITANDVRAALAAGFQRHLAKPVAFTDLLAAIEEVAQ
jgi:CheY-like chemotaxis protein